MAVIGATRDAVEDRLARQTGWVELAVVNSTTIQAISGERTAVDDVVADVDLVGAGGAQPEATQVVGALHAALGDRAPAGVLVAVSPGERKAEIVTGEEAQRRIPDRSCQLAMMSMVASCKENEILEGIIEALRMLSDAAGAKYAAH